MKKIISVIQLNTYIKSLFDKDFVLKNLQVEGEVYNCKKHSSGHVYFTLKDEKASINCVMFANYRTGREALTDGNKVVIKGSVSAYEKSGSYQIYVREVKASGTGELYILFEQLKKRLSDEGLFDEKIKKKIPKYAKRIGIVTSPTGAAIRDIVRVAKRRNPYIELELYPVLVQGKEAATEIVEAIEWFNIKAEVDLVIVARGGGSYEDLWAFNEEKVAYAIYKSNLPVITGVGHEIDFTISDYVADLRTATPSAAAELAVFDYYELINFFDYAKLRLSNNFKTIIEDKRKQILNYKSHLDYLSPRRKLEDKIFRLDKLEEELEYKFKNCFEHKKRVLELLELKIREKKAKRTLPEGYAYLKRQDKIIKSIKDVEKGSRLEVILNDGTIEVEVINKVLKEV